MGTCNKQSKNISIVNTDMEQARKISGGLSDHKNSKLGGDKPARKLNAKRQRGFIHILLLVFTVLGISLWGISEVVQRRDEGTVIKEQAKVTSLNEVKRLLLNYALIAPQRLEVDNHAGAYEAYTQTHREPFRYFSLPCPDVYANNTGVEGYSDIVGELNGQYRTFQCDFVGDHSLPIEPNATTGLLPWNTRSDLIPGGIGFVYTRGVGDVVDSNGDRFWYSVSPNLRQSNYAINPHFLLRQNIHWYNIVETPSNETTERVAAVVYSPGTSPFTSLTVSRIPNLGEVGSVVTVAPNPRAYLEGEGLYNEWYDGTSANNDNLNIMVEKVAQGEYSDRVSYITIEELAAQGGSGIEELYGESSPFFDIPAGRGEYFGVSELLRAHFNRYGYLPAPAAFTESAARSYSRPEGIPFVVKNDFVEEIDPGFGNVEDQRQEKSFQISRNGILREGSARVVRVVLPARNIRKIYLQKGSRLVREESGSRLAYPYNIELYQMNTALNQDFLNTRAIQSLVSGEHYPTNLFGVVSDASQLEGFNYQVPTVRVFESADSQPVAGNGGIRFLRRQEAAVGITTFAALAEPTQAYILDQDIWIESFEGSGSTGLRVDNYKGEHGFGLQVQLPVGTQITINGSIDSSMELPRDYEARGSLISPASDEFILDEQAPQPVLFASTSTEGITLLLPINDLPVVSGEIGFLPVDDMQVEYIQTNVTVVFGSTRLSGSNEPITVHGGVTLADIVPISYLPVDMEFYTNQRLILVPFPPAGLEFFNATRSRTPHPLYINNDGETAVTSRVFTMPAGTRIYYPPNSTINLGTDFTFPPGTKALLPRGARMKVDIEESMAGFVFPISVTPPPIEQRTVAPGGRVYGGTRDEVEVVLYHGGMMELSGLSMTPDNPGTRVILENGFGVDSDQELFDIELQTSYTAGSAAGSDNFDGGVLQPLTGRQLHDAIAPIRLDASFFNAVDPMFFLFDISRARLRFLKRPRNLPLIRTPLRSSSNTTVTLNPGDAFPASSAGNIFPSGTIATVTTVLTLQNRPVIPNIPLGGDEIVAVPVRVETGAGLGSLVTTYNFRINEETQFILPASAPGGGQLLYDPMDFPKIDITSGLGTQSLLREFVFPEGTYIFDSSFENLDNIERSNRSGGAVLAGPLTVALARAIDGGRGIVINELIMNNVRDYIYISRPVDLPTLAVTILANSDIDLVRGVAWPPGSIRSFPSVAEDLRAVSAEQIVMYFVDGVVLTAHNAGDFSLVDDNLYGGVPTSLVINNMNSTTTINRIEVDYVRHFSRGPLHYGRGDSSEILGNQSFRLPPGSFIIIPPGSTLDFLSPNRHSTVGFSAETADIAFLPPDITAIVPLGGMVTLNGTPVGGPNIITYLRLGSNGRTGLAMVAHEDLLPTSPIIDFAGNAYLVETERAANIPIREKHTSYIPAGSRGDIFGNITNRKSRDFGVNMLPSDSGEFLRNFPMVYAVAADCRQGNGGGEDCAENGNGLEFSVGIDEEVILESDMVAAGNIYITATDTLPDASRQVLTVEIWKLGEFNSIKSTGIRGPSKGMGHVQAVYVDANTGGVTFDPVPPAIAGSFQPAPAIPDPTDVVVIRRVNNSVDKEELRTYMLDVNINRASITADRTVLEDGHYALMEAITLHAGGYTDGRTGTALGRIILESGDVFESGYDAQIIATTPASSGAKIFGRDSHITLTVQGLSTDVELEDYHVLNPVQYEVVVDAESRYASFDYAGNLLNEVVAGDRVKTPGIRTRSVVSSDNVAVAATDITVANNASIAMDQGYLWQGYLNAKSGELTVTLNFSENSDLVAAGVGASAFIRVHSQAELLNFWGSGMERLEGLDHRSIARSPEFLTMGPANGISLANFVDTNTENANEWVYNRDVIYLGNQNVNSEYDGGYSLGSSSRYDGVDDDDIVYAAQGERPSGFRSPVAGGGSTRNLRVRVREDDGTIITEDQTATWTPYSEVWAFPEGRPIRPSLPIGPTFRNPPFGNVVARPAGQLTWGYTNHPFDLVDQSYASTQDDVWAVRKTANPYGTNLKFDENAEVVLMVNGVPATAYFNPPPYQMTGRRIALPYQATRYPKFANIIFPIAATVIGPNYGPNYKCDSEQAAFASMAAPNNVPNDALSDTVAPYRIIRNIRSLVVEEFLGITRIPGVLLGSPLEVETLPSIRASANCDDYYLRSPAFSSRIRRNTVPATNHHLPLYSDYYYSRPGVGDLPYREDLVLLNPDPSAVDILPNIRYRDLVVTVITSLPAPLDSATVTIHEAFLSVTDTRLTILDPSRQKRRDPYPYETRTRNTINILRPSAQGEEVRSPSAGDPVAHFDISKVAGHSDASTNALINAQRTNPGSYTVPGRYVPSTVFISSVSIVADLANDMQLGLTGGAVRSVPFDADMFFYIDRAYNTEDPNFLATTPPGAAAVRGGIPRQSLQFGDNFQISGPGAFVQHFGGESEEAVRQVYAERSRFMNTLFNMSDKELSNIYSEVSYACESESDFVTRYTAFTRFVPAEYTCPQIYNPENASYWIPIISGVVAFEGLNVSLSGQPSALDSMDVVMVLPQPEATVEDSSGNMQVIYAGSIIEPRRRIIHPSTRIPADSRLSIIGVAEAAVDVSPVNAPTPIEFIRSQGEPFMRAWDFNYTPIRATTAGGDVYIVEPKYFEEDRIINFGSSSGTGLPSTGCPRSSTNPTGRNNDPSSAGCDPFNNPNAAETTYVIGDTLRTTVRYDGTLARGFLMNQRMLTIQNNYYAGNPVFTDDNGFLPIFPYRPYNPRILPILGGFNGAFLDGQRWGPIGGSDGPTPTPTAGAPASFNIRGYPGPVNPANTNINFTPGNEVTPLGNPLSWNWLHRFETTTLDRSGINSGHNFIPLGGARQFAVSYSEELVPFNVYREYIFHPVFSAGSDPGLRTSKTVRTNRRRCGRYDSSGSNTDNPVLFPATPDELFADAYGPATSRNPADPFIDLPCTGDASHYWVGLISDSSSSEFPDAKDAVQTDEDEFVALRLPHRIELSGDNIAVNGYRGYTPYPNTPNAHFTFPSNSIANVLNVDAASWESVHPYASRFLPGAVFSNEGGYHYPRFDNLLVPAGFADGSEAARQRAFITYGEEVEIQTNNDGHRRINIGGKHVMHYSRTESAPGNYAYTNTPVYTNVWIKLTDGGVLTDSVTGETTFLPGGTVLNPILGTYVVGNGTGIFPEELRSNYQGRAEIGNPLDPVERIVEVVRPVLVIPKGATVRVGTGGGNITGVKAAAMFSVTPLQNVECAYGDIADSNFIESGVANTVVIDQMREGAVNHPANEIGIGLSYVESKFPSSNLTPRDPNLTLGHPCAWLDDRENTDGDRFFIYRSRRRFVEPYKTRVVSNDHTYLLGGRLRLNVGS